MTRKHYQALAEILGTSMAWNSDPEAIARAIMNYLEEDNESFNRETFVKAIFKAKQEAE
jgi:glutamate racemase